MRTTLDIDYDVLQAAKEIAARESKTAGAVVSDLLRKSLTMSSPAGEVVFQNGFPQIPTGGKIITSEMIESLLEDDN